MAPPDRVERAETSEGRMPRCGAAEAAARRREVIWAGSTCRHAARGVMR